MHRQIVREETAVRGTREGSLVALGVLLDTMIVRSVLVTAINLDLGGEIWWPSKLDRGEAPSEMAATEPQDAIAR